MSFRFSYAILEKNKAVYFLPRAYLGLALGTVAFSAASGLGEVLISPSVLSFAEGLGLTVEQLSMKAGMALGVLFPIAAIFIFLHIFKTKPKKDTALLNETL